MKTFLKYSGFLAAVIAVVGFILMMATPAFSNGDHVINGTAAIFGEDLGEVLGLSGHLDAAWSATLGWILAIIGMIALILGVVLPLLKLEKFAGLVNLIALVALVIAGVFIFISQPCSVTGSGYGGSATTNPYSDHTLTATWIIAAILYIAAGAIAILPAAMDLFGKKKK
ncbi:MAG: hypothetical protein K6F36_02950 [Bacilli bacterium]|nr:hypothetical protein [Bacilli bacterium]